MVDPALMPINPVPPPLVLEKILLNNTPATNRAEIKIAYGYRNLELDYSAPSFNSPERIRFRHQLVGLDQDWVDAGKARSVSYPRLAPGSYVFRFTACNSDGVWNEKSVSIAFQITPAYWQTAWFRGLAVFVFSGLVAVGVRYRYIQTMRRKLRSLEQAHAIERERMRIARDIHDDLGARLTQMAFLSEITSNELGSNSKAGERLEKIATGSRQAIRSLEEIVWAVTPPEGYAAGLFRLPEPLCQRILSRHGNSLPPGFALDDSGHSAFLRSAPSSVSGLQRDAEQHPQTRSGNRGLAADETHGITTGSVD